MAKDVKRALMIAKAEGGEVARGQRKRDAGFDPDRVLYHGTNKDIQAFTPKRAGKRETMGLKGTHLADNPEFANLYAEGRGANVMPVHARGNFLDAGKLVYEGSPEHEVLNELLKGQRNVRALWNTDHEGKRVAPPLHSYLDAVSPQKAERILRAKGYDGVTYPAKYGFNDGRVSARSNATVVFDPKNIRSQFAQFDPAHNDSDDISKAAGGSATKRALMIARDQRALLRRIANIYPGPGGGMDPSPGGGGYSGPGGGKYIGPSRYADGGGVDFKQDNPAVSRGNTEWLASKQRTAYSDPALLRGAITGYFKDVVHIPVDMLEGVPGANKENPVPGTYKFDELMKDVKREGWKPTPILVGVNHKGKPHILEGNHRVAVARALGQTHIPGDIRWWNGGEEVDGDWHPKNVTPRLKPYKRATGGSVPPFKLYSGAAKIIKSKGQAKATPQQYAAMPGIKPDELKHSKFDTLGSKALPREEVIKHLEDNAVPLEETQLGGGSRKTPKFDDPKYQLPGGENYREVLLHTPVEAPPESPEAEKARARADAAGRAYDDALTDQLSGTPRFSDDEYRRASDEHDAANTALRRFEASREREKAQAEFRGGHWETPNVLAHLRMSDRVGPNGEKILHLEESQSDWAQKGRKKGFKTGAAQRYEDWRDGALERAKQKLAEKNIPEETAQNFLTAMGMGNRQVGHDVLAKFVGEKDHADKLWHEHLEDQQALPSGPYVGNTQKWTDLALKRVLHEAAHGGYDKIVVTPGDEQSKRWDEPSLVKYYDDILPKRLQALAQRHDPQAKVNLHGAHLNTRGEWPFPIRIADEGENRWLMGRSPHVDSKEEQKLGGPFSSDAAADDAREQFYKGYTQPVHSLDVTPQMRDSIKANGFNSFKRGGEVGDDPIRNWQWRPTEDVRNELQLDEIPSHVHKFGEFMDESARKAMNEGFTPRDLIKAYTITRASIQRRARPVEAIRKSGLILPPDLKGVLRPEGAFGHWLHTKHGQRYLDEAEAGRVDEEAIADAQKIMKPYGKTKIDLPDALRWAPANLPGQEGRISELVTRAYRGHDHPDDWRDATAGLKGIGPAKKGFYGANLGYGKLPTLDAREITVHTGRPTKEATPYLRKKGAADAAVDRLADRQTELGLKHDKSMSPFYQHLTHHTVWDKASGETTTHDDLMHPMRHAKDGGRQGYKTGGTPPTVGHPLAHGLLEAFPEGFKDVPEEHLRQMLRNPFTDATEKEVRAALHTSPATHNLLYRASQLTGHPTQKLMQHLLPAGGPKEPKRTGITSLRQPDLIERAMATITPNWRIAVAKPRPLTPEDLFKMRAVSVAGMSDRSPAGFDVSGADKVDFGEDISALGGNDFNLMPYSIKHNIGWAGARTPITALGNAAKTKLKEVKEKYGVDAQPLLTTKLMGLQSNDQTHMVMRAAAHLLRNAPVTDADAEAFNEYVRNQRPAAKQGKIQPPYMPDFPGIKHETLYDYLMRQKMPNRTALIKAMDIGAWNKKGIPNPVSIRMAFTKPELIVAPEGTPGAMFATMDPGNPHHTGDSGHGSYPVGATGKNVGGLDRIVPKEAFHQTYFDQPKVKAKVAAGNNPQVMSGYIKSPVTQYHDQEWLDRIMPVYENAPPFRRAGGRVGYADGGGVDQLLQNLKGSFSNLNQQVAAQAPQQQAPANYQAMLGQAAGPNDAHMMSLATLGRGYEGLFPKAAAPTTPPAAAPVAPAAAPVEPTAQPGNAANNYSSWMTEILGGGGDGGSFKRGGRTNNMVERALAVTRRK